MPSCCSICLEPGADAFPPCGFASAEPLFHAHCLARAQEQCSQRCPHCNCAPPLREHVFLSVKRHALLTPKELERALAALAACRESVRTQDELLFFDFLGIRADDALLNLILTFGITFISTFAGIYKSAMADRAKNSS